MTAHSPAVVASFIPQLEQAREDFLSARQEAASQTQAKKLRTFAFLSGADILAMPRTQWRMKGALPAAGIAAIFGPSGSGKSFLALDMAFAIAEGAEWFGIRALASPVVYVNLESSGGLKLRLTAWQMDRKRPIPDGARFVIEPFHILEDTESLEAGIAAGSVVFVDTLNAATSGLDENSSRDMGLILEAAKTLQRLTGGLVVLVHHTGKDAAKGLRGHSSLLAALDAVIEVGRNGDARYWRMSKSKESEDGKRRGFRLKPVGLGYDEDGEPETSCVVEPDNTPVQEEKPLTPSLKYALESLEAALNEDGSNSVHVDVWRNKFYAHHTADTTNAKKVAFRRARTELQGMGRITVIDDKYSIVGRKIEIEGIGTDGTKPVQQGNLYPTPNHDGTGTTGTHSFRSVPCVPPCEGPGYE